MRTTSSIGDLLAAAAALGKYAGPIGAGAIAAVLRTYDTNGDDRLTWDDANGGTRLPQFFGDLTRTVGELVVAAEHSIS